jgi:hypothetical protein
MFPWLQVTKVALFRALGSYYRLLFPYILLVHSAAQGEPVGMDFLTWKFPSSLTRFWPSHTRFTPQITLHTTCFMQVSCLSTLWPWRWRQYVPLKHQLSFTRLYGIITQRTELIEQFAIWRGPLHLKKKHTFWLFFCLKNSISFSHTQVEEPYSWRGQTPYL